MKKQLIFAALGAIFMASCADTWDREYSGVNPQKEGYEYLTQYLPLKEYVDRAKYPNFKLGIATTASEYIQQQLVYALVNSNADETVAGNAMKMASCVDDKGNMSFDNAVSFVNAATDAGLNVYGHTLAWHSQQPVKYLTGLLKDKEIEVDPNDANNFIKYTCGDSGANSWDKQAIYTLPVALEQGVDYTLKVDIKAADAGVCGLWPIWEASPNKNQWGGSNDVQYLADNEVGTDWTTCVWKFNAMFTHDKLQFVFGLMSGFISFDNLVLVKDGTEDNLIANGDFAEASVSGWASNWNGPSFEVGSESNALVAVPEYLLQADFNDNNNPFGGWGNNSTREIVAGAGPDGSAALKMSNPSETDFWSAQMAYDVTTPFEEGQKYFLKFSVKGSGSGTLRSGFQVTSDYSSAGDFANVSFNTEWQEVTLSCTCSKAGGTRLIFSFGDYAGDIYIDDFAFYYEVMGNTIPLTPEEKHDTLVWAMDRWIGGMMQAMEGKVKAWDVVNEAISGGDADAEGVYALQHDNGSGDFFWQDYMGDLDYVRTAVASARKHFEANGGTPSELKLFVNDYNLESDWDQNGKLKSLIKWIARWEADGVTRIDGVGSQMHISCYADPIVQENKKNAIVESFKLMAATGKLVRISELDMGYVDASGTSVSTANLTEAQHLEMAELYKFIVSKYLELIPAAQQWGICQWAATDSPAESGWRANEPIGLWDLNYNRKHTYAGFADGLAGK